MSRVYASPVSSWRSAASCLVFAAPLELDSSVAAKCVRDVAEVSQNGPSWVVRALRGLDQLRDLSVDWNDGAEPPNRTALYWTERTIEALREMDFQPERVVPSAEGGAGIVFAKDQLYADIECFNDGSIYAAFSDRHEQREIWQVDQDNIKESLERIRERFRT